MSPTAQRIAIATACGIPVCSSCKNLIDPECCHCGSPMKSHGYQDGHSGVPMGCLCGYAEQPQPEWCGVPDYLNSLDAMHEAEETMNSDQWLRFSWIFLEHAIANPHSPHIMHATATQRAEAFLRTIGKWVAP